ncbi:beta-1,6-N-acetylglucosaminyltransferase [Parasphingorhabdus sp.]|uniref:beta-1,6-N-acetylglucosaminyltransferase n=1 Tax=Parasphingorhabdus sp. TaxID=2709688 RepID=UPI0032641E68
MFGFVILSHKSPGQLLRLCETLNRLHNAPPIACHHDFSQAELDQKLFPPNVHFVDNWVTTGWGKWSLVEATLRGLRQLYSVSDPDYFVLLSGADYPIATASKIHADLEQSGADAFIDAFPVEESLAGNVPQGSPLLAHHRARYNLELERNRYIRAQLKIPIIRFRPPQHSSTLERYPRLGGTTVTLPFNSPSSPFDRTYRCYAGSQWFTGNRKVANKLLNPNEKDLKLQRYYRSRINSDESYFQTVICNDDSLSYQDKSFRYLIWRGAHPIDLGVEQFQDIIGSGLHFARKFHPDDPVLDMINEQLK